MVTLEKDFEPPQRSSDIFGKVVYDNTPDPEVKYVSIVCLCCVSVLCVFMYGITDLINTLLF